MCSIKFFFICSGFFLKNLTGANSDRILRKITHVILDEVHERERSTDMLMNALKNAMQLHTHLKLILMSATLDADKFSTYFDHCPIIDVPGKSYAVAVSYLPDILLFTKYEFEGSEQASQEGRLFEIIITHFANK